MNGNNAKFKANPEAFLRNTGILCSSMVRNSQVDGFKNIQRHDVREFDLVPNGRFVEPTEDDVRIDYGGEVVARLGPDYGAADGVSGNGVIVRRCGGWKAIVSTMVFGARSATVESAEF